jgi:hydrogenase maturation protease
MRKVLLIGYGNPGRLDDGLGPAFADAVAQRRLPGVTVDADYQLLVEDAAAASAQDVVVFADAAVSGREPFSFRRVEPSSETGFTTHSLAPEAVLGLARDMFGSRAEGYLLGIRGYLFNDFGEQLSDGARANLDAAVRFLEGVIVNDLFADAASALG